MSEEKKTPAFLSTANIKQFISYFAVGGVSALVEWFSFWFLGRVFVLEYIPATALAFILSTTTNWFLGRTFTFKDSDLTKNKSKEIFQVFGVSGVGLLMNIGLMYLFVTVIGLNTELLKTASKILATGIVFIWNFLARKFWIYK